MIAVDTNLLVYAHRTDSEWHEQAAACIGELAEAKAEWALAHSSHGQGSPSIRSASQPVVDVIVREPFFGSTRITTCP